jgi:hypothetical protein
VERARRRPLEGIHVTVPAIFLGGVLSRRGHFVLGPRTFLHRRQSARAGLLNVLRRGRIASIDVADRHERARWRHLRARTRVESRSTTRLRSRRSSTIPVPRLAATQARRTETAEPANCAGKESDRIRRWRTTCVARASIEVFDDGFAIEGPTPGARRQCRSATTVRHGDGGRTWSHGRTEIDDARRLRFRTGSLQTSTLVHCEPMSSATQSHLFGLIGDGHQARRRSS